MNKKELTKKIGERCAKKRYLINQILKKKEHIEKMKRQVGNLHEEIERLVKLKNG